MKIKSKKKKAIDIADSGALSDLAFLLIVFFIVIAVFNINKGFILGLPQKNSTKILNTKDIISVNLTKDNTLFFNNRVYEPEELEEHVAEMLNERPNLTFMLKISGEAEYQNVVNIVDMIEKIDVENFSFSLLEEN